MISENLASSPVPGYRKQEVSFMATSAGMQAERADQVVKACWHLDTLADGAAIVKLGA